MTTSAPAPSTATPFNCKGGSSTRILLALNRMQHNVEALADDHAASRRATIIGAKLAFLNAHSASPVDDEINQSLAFLNDVQSKLSNQRSSAGQANSVTVATHTEPLSKESASLATKLHTVLTEIQHLSNAYVKNTPNLLKNATSPETFTAFTAFENKIFSLDKELAQIRKEQTALAVRLDSAEKTVINLLSDEHKTFFIRKRDERRGPQG